MRIRLTVDIRGRHFDGGAEIEVPHDMLRCFEPVDLCDHPVTACFSPNGATNTTFKVVEKTRDDAADILAKELARLIVGEMKKLDTKNGY